MAHGNADRRGPVVLVGFMAAGKSTVGRLLARRLDGAFLDTDDEIEARFGMPVADIFRLNGEATFRDAERQLISNLAVGPRDVVALGGGAFIDPQVRHILNGRATTVWLDAPFELIRSRLARSTARPLASGKSDSELLELWRERQKFYAKAHLRVPISKGHPEEVVEKILAEILSG